VPWGTGRGISPGSCGGPPIAGQANPVRDRIRIQLDNNSPEIARCAEFFARTAGEIEASATAQSARCGPCGNSGYTPPKPVRSSANCTSGFRGVRDPLTATALDWKPGPARPPEQAVLVRVMCSSSRARSSSGSRRKSRHNCRNSTRARFSLNATHTHTARLRG